MFFTNKQINCTVLKRSLTPRSGGEECSSRGLAVAVRELRPVFEVQHACGNGAALALLCVGGHRGWSVMETSWHQNTVIYQGSKGFLSNTRLYDVSDFT